ncbi:hypothetical protein Tco_1304772 [Tanacetum coccineum]
MNYLVEETDGELLIRFITHGEQPLHVVTQVSLAETIDRLARSLLIQGLPNDIYSLIDNNDIAQELWDALERQMRGSEYWRERFMNYLVEETDGELLIRFITHGEQPLPVVTQVSLAGTIDRLARPLLIQGLPNDIYSLIDNNDIAQELWDALERQMRGSEYVW